MTSISVSLILALIHLAVSLVACQHLCHKNRTSFSFQHFDCSTDRSLRCTGDCVTSGGGNVNITSYDLKSWGRVMYSPGLRLMDKDTKRVALFSTNFTFVMKGDNRLRAGEGLAFVMQANPDYQGHSGGFLGLYNKDGTAGTPTVAVEFDIFRDWFSGLFRFDDLNNNHVGLDIESINSRIQADAGLVGIDLAKEQSVTAWIDYSPAAKDVEGRLQVRISKNKTRPVLPLLSYEIDLSDYIHEVMYLGFSATTGDHVIGGCLSYHTILSWSFETWGLSPETPPPEPSPRSAPAPSPTPIWPPLPVPPESPTPSSHPAPAVSPVPPDSPPLAPPHPSPSYPSPHPAPPPGAPPDHPPPAEPPPAPAPTPSKHPSPPPHVPPPSFPPPAPSSSPPPAPSPAIAPAPAPIPEPKPNPNEGHWGLGTWSAAAVVFAGLFFLYVFCVYENVRRE